MEFRYWFERKELFNDLKKELKDQILGILGPHQDVNYVMATKIADYKDQDGILSGPNYIIKLLQSNAKISDLMNKSVPGEVNKANQIVNWLKSSGPTDTIGDLFQQIGIAGNPITFNKSAKPIEKIDPNRPKESPKIKQAPIQGQVPMPYDSPMNI